MSHLNINLCLTFHRTYAKLRSKLDEELGTYNGIDFDDFALLHSLESAKEPTSLELLAADLCVSRSAMLRRLRPLQKIGLIAYQGGVTDGHIAIRPAGRGLIKTANDTVGGVGDTLFPAGDLERLNEALTTCELARCS